MGSVGVVPVAECQLAAGAVATHSLAIPGVLHLQTDVSAAHGLRRRALVEGESPAVDILLERALALTRVAVRRRPLEEEGHGPAVDEADIDPVHNRSSGHAEGR